MCHSTESRPPAAPGAGAVADSGDLELTASDGTVFSAYQSVPEAPNGMNIVILPDVRGVHPYYKALADNFAAAGFHVAVVDYYGRNVGVGERGDDFDWERYLPEVTPGNIKLDVAAAVAHLNQANAGPTFTVGFCYGGSESWRLSAADLDLAGVIGFYGQPKNVREELPDFTAPALLLIAGADVATTQEDFAAFADELKNAGKTHEMHVYDGAPHSFFDRSFGDWKDACDDAWIRILAFTHLHGKVRKPVSA